MALQRIGIVNPSANVDTVLASFSQAHLVSVIATNKAATSVPVLRVTIYVVPFNAVIENQYAYVTYNLTIGLGQSFETFRFAVNSGDALYVRANTDDASFQCVGIMQDDAIQPEDLPQSFSNKVIRGSNNNLIYLDQGATNQRPGNVDEGYVRYNIETQRLEVYVGLGTWRSLKWSDE